jgi:hydroxypyruvate isomerase
LASGKKEWRDKFLQRCKEAVEVAKRVNAKWMTVVPGNYDRSIPIGIQTGHVIESLYGKRHIRTTWLGYGIGGIE